MPVNRKLFVGPATVSVAALAFMLGAPAASAQTEPPQVRTAFANAHSRIHLDEKLLSRSGDRKSGIAALQKVDVQLTALEGRLFR